MVACKPLSNNPNKAVNDGKKPRMNIYVPRGRRTACISHKACLGLSRRAAENAKTHKLRATGKTASNRVGSEMT